MKEIELTQGQVAIVDDEDYEYLSSWKWYARKRRNTYYALTSIYKPRKTLFMHRVILRATDGFMVDHKNGNGLDNRKENIRLCTNAQNQHNRFFRKGKFGYKGICEVAPGRYQAKAVYLGRNFTTKYYKSAKEAAYAYDAMAKELFGEFANLNFPEEQ